MLRWSPVNGTDGLSVTSFAIGKSSSNPLALAATTSGLLVSLDYGHSWRAAPGVLGKLTIFAVCLPSAHEGDRLVVLGGADGVVYTRDLDSLKASRLPQEGIGVVALVASPEFVSDGVLLAGTLDYGILHSTDRGESWKARHYGLQDLGVFALTISPDFVRDELALVGTSTGIYRTPNGGLAWREGILPNEEESILSIQFSPQYPANPCIFAGSESGKIIVSEDEGRRWLEFCMLAPDLPVNALECITRPDMGNILVAGAGSSLFVSSDDGDHWDIQEVGEEILCLASGFSQDGRNFILVGLMGGGIWRAE